MTTKKELTVSTTPMEIISKAVTGGVDIANLEKLMEMQERWEDRQAKKAFDAALAEFKSEPLTIDKDRHVKYKTKAGTIVEYDHETLGNVINTVTPALSKSGLSLSWRTAVEGNFIKVTAVLSHELGHSERTALAATADTSGNKNALQGVGSTISYLKRYTGLAILGLTSGDLDDDGKKGGDIEQPSGNGYKEEQPEETYLDRCLAYVDSFTEKSLDEFVVMKETKLPDALKSLANDGERKKLIALVNSVEGFLLDTKRGAK